MATVRPAASATCAGYLRVEESSGCASLLAAQGQQIAPVGVNFVTTGFEGCEHAVHPLSSSLTANLPPARRDEDDQKMMARHIPSTRKRCMPARQRCTRPRALKNAHLLLSRWMSMRTASGFKGGLLCLFKMHWLLLVCSGSDGICSDDITHLAVSDICYATQYDLGSHPKTVSGIYGADTA